MFLLQRSQSAFSLASDDSPEKLPEEAGGASSSLQEYASLKRKAKAAALPSWKSVDRLDNSSRFGSAPCEKHMERFSKFFWTLKPK